MIDIAEIFGSKALDEDKLLACGFERADGGGFSRTFQILDDHLSDGEVVELIKKSYAIVNA